MGAANVRKKSTIASNKSQIKEDPNPLFQNVENISTVIYSSFVIQSLALSFNILLPKEITAQILLSMREARKWKKSRGFVTGSEKYEVVVMGASKVGKSTLAREYAVGSRLFCISYDPTIEDSYQKRCHVDDGEIYSNIVDTGTEQFTAMRDLYIKNGHGFLLLFAVNDRNSLHELEEFRENIMRVKDTDQFPLVIVGTKSDFKLEQRQVTSLEGLEFAKKCGPHVPYLEVSCRDRINIEEPFSELFREISLYQSQLPKPQSHHRKSKKTLLD